MPTYQDLKTLNDQNFSDNPTASYQNLKNQNDLKVPEITSKGVDARDYGKSSLFQNATADTVYENQSKSIASPFASDYFNSKTWGIDLGEVTNRHKNIYGGVNPYSKAVDFEDLRRNEQGNFQAGVNLFNQFVGKTAVNALGGVIGGFYSLGAAAINGDASLLFDNSVNRAFDKGTKWVEENNSVFTSQRARDNAPLGFFSFETVKDFTDAYSFIAGAVASELLIDVASGGLGLAGLPGRISKGAGLLARTEGRLAKSIGLGNGVRNSRNFITRSEELGKLLTSIDPNDVNRLQEVARNVGSTVEDLQKYRKSLDNFNNTIKSGRQIVTGTFWEAGLESRHTKDELLNSELSKLDDFINSNTSMTNEEKEDYRTKETQRITDLANTAGLWTFGLNTAVLGASNYIQFPTIFGGRELSQANRMTGSLTRRGIADYVKNGGKYTDILKTVGRALKSPATEFTEETLQGAINIGSKSYYESMMGTRTSNGEILPSVASLSDSVIKGLGDTYGTSEGIKEGVIGALVGAIGLPMLRKNKSGKLRPYMTGGIFEAVRDNRESNSNINQAINDLNLNEFDTLISYNKDNAILATIDTKKEDIANLSNNKFDTDRLNDNKIFRHVTDRLDKGLEDYMNSDINDLKNLSLEEYKTRFKKSDNFTQAQKDKEVNDFSNKVGIYSDAYKKVYEGLEMSRINNNAISKKLFNTLTYAVANEKIYKQRQKELTDSLLSNKNIDLNNEELIELARLDDKYSAYTKDINDYIKSREQVKLDKFNEKKGRINNRIQTIRSRVGENNQSLLDEVLNKDENTIEYLTNLISLQKEFESKTYQDLIADSEEIFKSVSDLNTLIEEAKLLDLNKLKETKFSANKSPIVRNKRKSGPEILEGIKNNIEKNSSKSLEILRGKKDTPTQKEIEDYINLKLRADDAIKRNNSNNASSFLDNINVNNQDIEDQLKELSNITKNQILALDIANNLYGFDNKAYGKIVNAEFEENLSNLRNDSYLALQSLIRQDDEDYMAELSANIDNSIENIKATLEEYKDLITEDTLKYINDEVTKAEDINASLVKYLETLDKKEDVAKDTKQEDDRNEEQATINQITLDAKNQEEEVKIVNEQLEGKVNTPEFNNDKVVFLSSKNLHTITPTSNTNANGIKEKIDNGTIKYNSGAIASYLEDNEKSNGFIEYILPVAESYYRGKDKVQANPELLKEDLESIDLDVKTFIIHSPVNVDIYNKEIEIFEGEQDFDVTEDDTVAHNFLYFAPKLDNNISTTEKYNQLKGELDYNYSDKLTELQAQLTEKILSQEEYNKEKAIVDKQYERDNNALEASGIINTNNINDKVLFSFRQGLLYNNYKNSSNELKMRLGNIVNGYLEKVGDTSFEVEEYALVNDSENNNLIENINDIKPEDILFGNQTGEYKDFNGNKVKLNRGSLVDKVNALTGRIYLKYRTVNNQEIPIMLNRSKLSNSPIIYDEITHQLQEYLKSKKPSETIVLKNESLTFVKGKSYQDFFRTFLNEKSNSADPIIVDTFNINTKNNNIYFGKLDLAINSPETFEANKTAILDTLSNMRYYMNSISFRNPDGTFNRDFLEFIINNKLINHSFNSKTNNDRIFNPNNSTGQPFNKAIQFHILNSTPRLMAEYESEDNTKTNSLNDLANNLINKVNPIEQPVNTNTTESKPVWNNAFEDSPLPGSMADTLSKALNPVFEEAEPEWNNAFTEPDSSIDEDNIQFSNFVLDTSVSTPTINKEGENLVIEMITGGRPITQMTIQEQSLIEQVSIERKNILSDLFNNKNQGPISVGSEITAIAPFNKGITTGIIKSMVPNPLKKGLFSIELNTGERVVYNESKNNFTWIKGTNNIEINTTNDYVETLSHDDELQIKTNKAILNGRINRLSNKLDSGAISKDKIKNSFNEYNANTYEKFIEMLNILYSDNSSELNKFINFANKVFDKDENTNIFNC